MSIGDSSVIYKNKEALECEISELKSMVSEFEQVSEVLEKLPSKVRHEIMVPLGPLAFSPGYIINTNKVLMLLGSDLYAERTTFESRKTISRRLSQAEECLETLKKNLSKIEEALKLKSEFSVGMAECTEYDAEIREETSQDEFPLRNVVFADGTAEIREELADDVDISKVFSCPPLISGTDQKPYIPDFHVEDEDEQEKQDDEKTLETEVSRMKIGEEPKIPDDYGKKPISIFKQRMITRNK